MLETSKKLEIPRKVGYIQEIGCIKKVKYTNYINPRVAS